MAFDRDQFVGAIEARLAQLTCAGIVAPGDALDADVEALASRIEESGADGCRELASELRRLKATAGPALLDGVHALWRNWIAGRSPAAAPARAEAPDVEEDVAALRSDPELASMFVAEALDHLGTIESTLLKLDEQPGDLKLLNDLFRPFHTVKGNAGALGVATVQQTAHKIENLLDDCRAGRHTVGRGEIDVVLRGVDVLTAMITDLSARLSGQAGSDLQAERQSLMAAIDRLMIAPPEGASDAPPPAIVAAPPAAVEASETPARADGRPAPAKTEAVQAQATVKVDTRKLDTLVDTVGELVILQSLIQEHPELTRVADERLTRNLAQLRRITTDLQRSAMSMRMVPVRQTFQKMARLVRDLSKRAGKPIELVLSGEDTELDRKVVEDINDPLMHMVRNSIDHGIEAVEARRAAGKPDAGRLSLSAFHQGGNIVLEVADDGAGLDAPRIRAKAVASGIITADEALALADVYQLIFRPGFSTADRVTEISGRGVGMDVVRRNIDALRGRIDIQTEVGRGTTFSIKLPLTLAILEGLLIAVGRERFVLPTFSVSESLRPVDGQVHAVQGQPRMIQVRDRLLPLVWLSDLFGIADAVTDPLVSTVVVIEDDSARVGLVVDTLIGKQEVVIKSLGEMIGTLAGVAGGAILGDGRVGLILDAHGLVGLLHGELARAA